MSSAFSSPPETPTPFRTTRFNPRLPTHDSRAHRCIKLLCCVFLSLLLAASLIVFLLFLALRPHRPRFHLSSFSFPSLRNPPISFRVAARNPNRNIGIFYGSISGSVYYNDDRIGIDDRVVPPFYQPPKNTTVLEGEAGVEIGEDVGRQIGFDASGGSGRVRLRLVLRTVIRFRVSTWDSHRHPMHVTCDLEVGPAGDLVGEFKDKRCSIYFF